MIDEFKLNIMSYIHDRYNKNRRKFKEISCTNNVAIRFIKKMGIAKWELMSDIMDKETNSSLLILIGGIADREIPNTLYVNKRILSMDCEYIALLLISEYLTSRSLYFLKEFREYTLSGDFKTKYETIASILGFESLTRSHFNKHAIEAETCICKRDIGKAAIATENIINNFDIEIILEFNGIFYFSVEMQYVRTGIKGGTARVVLYDMVNRRVIGKNNNTYNKFMRDTKAVRKLIGSDICYL